MNSTLGPRNLGSILGETFRIYGRNFVRLIAIVAIVEVILYVLSLVLPVVIAGGGTGSPASLILMVIIFVVVSVLAYVLMEGALIHAVSEQSLGRTISIGRAYRSAWTRLGAMIGAEILACLAILGMSITIIGIPFAIYFAVRWDFIWQAALVERVGPRAALSRSSDVVRGNWWRVVGIMLVVIIIASVIGILLALILGLIPILGPIIGTILLTPIPTIAHTLLYYDLRVRKEQYGLKSLAGELDIKIDGDLESTDTIPIS